MTSAGLWISLALWAFCQVLLLVVPKAASRAFFLTGCMILLSSFSYFSSMPSASLQMYVEGAKFNLSIGRTFYMVVIGGVINIVLSVVFGVGVRCKTSFEVYYGTTFDFYGKRKGGSFEMEDIDEHGKWTQGWNEDYKNFDSSIYPQPVRHNGEIAYVNAGFVDESSNDSQIVYETKEDYQIAYVNEAFVNESTSESVLSYETKDDYQVAYVNGGFVNESSSGENLLSHDGVSRVSIVNIDTPIREFKRHSKFFRKSRREERKVEFICKDESEKSVDDRQINVLSNMSRVELVTKDLGDKHKQGEDDMVWYDTLDKLI